MSLTFARNHHLSTRMNCGIVLFIIAVYTSAVAQPTERPETANTCVIKLIGAPTAGSQGNSTGAGPVSSCSIKCTGEKLPVTIRVHPAVLNAQLETEGVTLVKDPEARGYLYFKDVRSLTVADSLFQGLIGPTLATVIFDASAGLFYNCKFIGNSQARAGGIYSAGRSLLHVYDSAFEDNKGSSYGAVSTTSGCRTVFKNTHFSNNIGGNGNGTDGGFVSGAVFSFQNTLTEFEKCEFKQNTASGSGAGAFTGVKRTVVKFTDCTIDGNSGENGALSLMDVSTGTMKNSQFLNNQAAGTGAAILLTLGSSLDVQGGSYQDNKGASGVIMAQDNSGVVLSDSTFSNNAGTSYGGVVTSLNGGKIEISSCKFESNSGSFGGVIFQDRALALDVTDSDFMSNSAQYTGGAVFQKDVTGTTLVGSKFEKNEGGSVGGALSQTGCGEVDWLSPGQQAVVECKDGATAKCDDIMIESCSFLGNSAAVQGAAVFNVRCTSVSVISTVLPSEESAIVQERCSTRKFEGNIGATTKASVVLRQCPAKTSSGRKLLNGWRAS